MIIRNVKPDESFMKYKKKSYKYIANISSKFMNNHYSLNYLLILYILFMLPFISILFKDNDYFPQAISKILRLFVPSNQRSAAAGVNSIIFNILVMIWGIFYWALAIYSFKVEDPLQSITYTLAILTKVSTFNIVPTVSQGVDSYEKTIDASQLMITRLFAGFNVLVITLAVITSLLLEFYSIRILRKKTIYWNFQNSVHFYGILFLVYKTVAISLKGSVKLWTMISIIVWFYMRKYAKASTGKYELIVQFSIYDIIVSADVAVLISILTENPSIGFASWVLILVFAVCRATVAAYKAQKEEPSIPTCNSPPQLFYDFYYRLKLKFQGDEESWLQKNKNLKSNIYHVHSVYCQNGICYLSQYMDEDNVQSLEDLISGIIKAKKDENVHNRIVFELWNLELGKGVDVSGLMRKRGITWSQDYIIFCIDEMSRDSEVTLQTSEDSRQAIVKAFYDLMAELADHYACFYDELTQNSPVTDILVNNGVAVMEKMEKLKAVYEQLLKLKLLNFRMAELYIDFVKSFVGLDFLDRDDAERLTSLQKNVEFEDISENPMPTFTVFPESGTIEDANAEAQKFFAMTRFQLKGKKVQDLLYPEVNNQFLKEGFKSDKIKKGGSFCSFFRKGQGLNACGSLRISKQAFKQKQLIVVEITPEPFSVLRNVFLVTSDFKMELSYKESTKLKDGCYRHQPMKVSWAHMFEEYIGPNRQKLEKSTMVKIPTSLRECSIVVKERKCLTEDFHILECQMFLTRQSSVVNKKLAKKQRNSFALANIVSAKYRKNRSESSQQQFEFNYIENLGSTKALLYGATVDNEQIHRIKKQKTLNQFQKNLNSTLVNGLIISDTDFAKGIKTYRLYEGDLYNVDLEDKEAYNNDLQLHVPQEKEEKNQTYSSFQRYFAISVMILGIILIGLTVYYLVTIKSSAVKITQLSSRHMKTHHVSVDFNRIVALLKDMSSGFNSNFPNYSIEQSIENSYIRLQDLKKTEIFQNDLYLMNFQGIQFEGNILELIDLLISHVNQVITRGDLSVIEDIHFAYDQLIQVIERAEQHLHDSVINQFEGLSKTRNKILLISVILIVCLVVLQVIFCYLSTEKIKKHLKPILYISDQESHKYYENALRAKSSVELVKKKIDLDTQNLLEPISQSNKRRYPKKAVIEQSIIKVVLVLVLLGLTIHLSCLFLFSSNFDQQLYLFGMMGENSEAIFQLYSGSMELSNKVSHLGFVQDFQIAILRENVHYISSQLDGFQFSPSLNSILKTLHFDNSCQLMKQWYNMTQQECHYMMPQFSITNPFEQGLIYYYNRQFYFFFNNVTQTFGYTSVYSSLFVRVYIKILDLMEGQILDTIRSISSSANIMSAVIIVIDCGYIFVFILVYCYFKRQYDQIKRVKQFFKNLLQAQRKTAQIDDEDQVVQKTERFNEQTPQPDDNEETKLLRKKMKKTTLDKEVRFKV